MKYQSKNYKICCVKQTKHNICTTCMTKRKDRKRNKKWKCRLCQNCKKFQKSNIFDSGSVQYVFCAILNTDVSMDRGTGAATIARSLIKLYSQLEADHVKTQYLDTWTNTGEKIIVLKGYDHKHLKYLQEEVKHIAIATHSHRQRWGRGQIILVLSVFGEKHDLEDIFEGLSYLR